MGIAPPNRNPHNLTIDTSVFVLSLCEDKHFSEQRPRAYLKPSEARGMFQEILSNLPPTWVLHQEQVVELRQVVKGIIARSLRVLEGHERPKPDQIYLDLDEVKNAQEFLSYLDALNNELISHPERKDVIYGAPGCPEAEEALSLANSVRDEVRATVGSDEFRDTLFCSFALANSNPNGTNNIIHCDSHFERIREILESHLSMLVRASPKDYHSLPEPQKILLQGFGSSSADRRKKTPVLKMPNFVNLLDFKFKTDIPDQSIKPIMAEKFPAPTID
jgi:hypothetical protein